MSGVVVGTVRDSYECILKSRNVIISLLDCVDPLLGRNEKSREVSL